jgi:hypothetical protein
VAVRRADSWFHARRIAAIEWGCASGHAMRRLACRSWHRRRRLWWRLSALTR